MFARTIAASILIVLLAALATGVSAERPVYTQAAVFWNTIQERDAILQAFPNLDIMKVKPGHAFIIVTDPDEIAEIEARGFRTETMIEDMERFYSSRLKGNNFGDFHTYSEATAYLDSMHTEHPDITTAKVSLGQTEEGRDIWAIKISDNPASRTRGSLRRAPPCPGGHHPGGRSRLHPLSLRRLRERSGGHLPR